MFFSIDFIPARHRHHWLAACRSGSADGAAPSGPLLAGHPVHLHQLFRPRCEREGVQQRGGVLARLKKLLTLWMRRAKRGVVCRCFFKTEGLALPHIHSSGFSSSIYATLWYLNLFTFRLCYPCFSILVMQQMKCELVGIGTVKMLVGIKRSGEKIQYCITAIGT